MPLPQQSHVSLSMAGNKSLTLIPAIADVKLKSMWHVLAETTSLMMLEALAQRHPARNLNADPSVGLRAHSIPLHALSKAQMTNHEQAETWIG